jgi:hypothetical protein
MRHCNRECTLTGNGILTSLGHSIVGRIFLTDFFVYATHDDELNNVVRTAILFFFVQKAFGGNLSENYRAHSDALG